MKAVLLKLALAVVALLAPVQGMLLSCLFLVCFDLISGVAASYKRGDAINSSGLKQTLLKLFVYELVIALAYVAQHFLMADAVPLMNIVTGYVGVTEFLSIVENLNSISGSNLLQALLEKLNQTKQ